MKVYSYIRVSSKDQHLERQEEAFLNFIKENKIEDYTIFTDKQSGKDFDRTGYQEMISKLEKGDLLVIKSIDRLGRNYDLIIEEWTKITKTIGADIVVLDMNLLDTRAKQNNLTGKFISDIVLQLLSYVAETERINIKQRQKEGIKIAKEKGVKFGRNNSLPDELIAAFKEDYKNRMSYVDLSSKYHMTPPTIAATAKRLGVFKKSNKNK